MPGMRIMPLASITSAPSRASPLSTADILPFSTRTSPPSISCSAGSMVSRSAPLINRGLFDPLKRGAMTEGDWADAWLPKAAEVVAAAARRRKDFRVISAITILRNWGSMCFAPAPVRHDAGCLSSRQHHAQRARSHGLCECITEGKILDHLDKRNTRSRSQTSLTSLADPTTLIFPID